MQTTNSPLRVSQRITWSIFLNESLFSAAFIATFTLLSINASLLTEATPWPAFRRRWA